MVKDRTRTVEAEGYEAGYAAGLEEREQERERLREILRGYHALMGNLHSLTDNPVGSAPWDAWMRGRKKYQKKAQAALRASVSEAAQDSEAEEGKP